MVKKVKYYQGLALFLFFLAQVTTAQNEDKQFFKNPLVPGNKKIPQKELLKLDNTSIDEFINYFSEKRKTPSYKYYNEKDNKTWIVSILDPVEFFKQEIEKSLTEKQNTPPAFEPNDKANKLSYRIDKLYKIADSTFKKGESNLISQEIDLLPASKEKVSLVLRHSDFKINNRNYYDETEKTYKKVEKIIESISDKYEKAIALFYTGNFLGKYQVDNIAAISIYFKARENIYNCNKPDNIKNQMQGVLCEQIGSVFSSETITLSVIKSFEYYSLAIKYYQLAEKKDDIERAALNIFGYWLYNNDKIKKHISDNILYESILKQYLFIMQMWLDEYDAHPSDNNAINYHGAYCIAIACRNQKKLAASINYFIEALYYAIKQKNYILIRSSISNISSMYGELNEWDLADRYIKLLSLFEATWKNLSIYNKAMQQGAAYRNLNKLDTALIVVNKVQFDTALMNSFFPPFAGKRYQEINNLKFSILSKLKDDSAHIYENYCHYDQEFYQDQFSQILTAESKAISEWLEHQGEKELTIREELIKTKEENNKILSKQNSFLDSLSKFNFLLSNLRKDSIIRQREYREKDSIYYTDTLRNANKFRESEKSRILAEGEKRTTQLFYLLGAILIGSISVVTWYRYKSKEKATKLLSEIEGINNLARNNIHNHQNDYGAFGNFIADGEIQKLVQYEEHYGDYLRLSYANWREGKKVSLWDDLQTAMAYFNAKKVQHSGLELILKQDVELFKEVAFLQTVFDTLIHNSIKYGFKSRNYSGVISIDCTRTNDYLFCSVEDNGTPPNNEQSFFREPKRGLGLLKSRIENIYKLKGKKPPFDCFTISILPERKGTKVCIKLPYEKIQSPDS